MTKLPIVNAAFSNINNKPAPAKSKPIGLKTAALLKKTVPKRSRQKYLWELYQKLVAEGYPAPQIKQEIRNLSFEGEGLPNFEGEDQRIDALFLLNDMEERVEVLRKANGFKESRLVNQAYNAWSKGLNG